MTRRVLSAVLAFGFTCCLLVEQASARTDPVFGRIDSIVRVLARITGLPEMHPVPYGRMSKRQLRHYLNKRIKKRL